MTTMPQPAGPQLGYTATYDAWNRLIKLASGGSTVVTYKYDGQNWRTTTIIASPAETREHYYSSAWQVLEERIGASILNRQFVWGLRYIDDLVRRERDTNGDGILDEKFGALQDANWNVAAIFVISAPTPEVRERYAYTAYGTAQQLSSTFLPQVSTYFWETRYAGYRWDAATGLLHVRNRDLHPPLGRWEARDAGGYGRRTPSAAVAQSPNEVIEVNLYSYVGNRPVIDVDPSGLACGCDGGSEDRATLGDFIKAFKDAKTVDSIIRALGKNSDVGLSVLGKKRTLSLGTGALFDMINALNKITPESQCGLWFKDALRRLVCAAATCKADCGPIASDANNAPLVKCIEELQLSCKSVLAQADMRVFMNTYADLVADNCQRMAADSLCCLNGKLRPGPPKGCGGRC